jgi:CRISPR type III-B/RAMP module-associated protein Cmr5
MISNHVQYTLEQQEAQYALKCVEKIPQDVKEEYNRQVKRISTMVLGCGLGQSLAFLSSKKKLKGFKELYNDISQWLKKMKIYTGSEDIINQVVNGSRSAYLEAQIFTIRLLQWLMRFSDAFQS